MFFFNFLFLSFINILSSKPFVSNFIELNLPDNWECEALNEDWSCQTINPESKKEALAVFTYRLSEPNDRLLEFLNFLKLPRNLKINDSELISKPIYSKFKNILGHEWVDALHENSELPDYSTRYLATIKNGRTLLLAFSVMKEKYNYYMPQFYSMVESLKIREGLAPMPSRGGLQGLIGRLDEGVFKKSARADFKPLTLADPKALKNKISPLILSIVLGVSVTIILILVFLKRKKSSRSSGRIR